MLMIMMATLTFIFEVIINHFLAKLYFRVHTRVKIRYPDSIRKHEVDAKSGRWFIEVSIMAKRAILSLRMGPRSLMETTFLSSGLTIVMLEIANSMNGWLLSILEMALLTL